MIGKCNKKYQALNSLTKKNAPSICLVAVIKDEKRFLDEWFVYHKIIGINHFFIYDDDESQPLRSSLIPHFDYLTVVNWWNMSPNEYRRQGNQNAAYNHAINNLISPFDWVVFLDSDEFIVLRHHKSIQEFLLDFKDEVSVSLNWHMFGHNGFFDNPNRLITTSLNRRLATPFQEVKTITKTAAIKSVETPHHSVLRYGERVDANHHTYIDEVYEGKTDVAHVNHYHCRSFKHWIGRVERGHINYNPLNSQQRWRFDKDACLERFVTTITRSYNEYIDDFMAQYRYDIHEQINLLDRNKLPKITLDTEQYINIANKLKITAEILMTKTRAFDSVGVLDDKVGIAIFLFHYSRFTDDSKYSEYAKKLLDEFTDEITVLPSENTSSRLAEYGIAVEHLVNASFIKMDTDDLLEDVDIFLSHLSIQALGYKPYSWKQIALLGDYFLARANNPFNNPNHARSDQNRLIMETTASFKEFNENQLAYLDFLCEFYFHGEYRPQVFKKIHQIAKSIKFDIDKNNLTFKTFNPLNIANTLLEFSQKTDDNVTHLIAKKILYKYEDAYFQYIIKSDQKDVLLKTGLYYVLLAKMLNDNLFIEKGVHCLRHAVIAKDNPVISPNDFKNTLRDGFIYLGLVNEWNKSLLNIIISALN